jgi:hypothetical protein
LADFRGYICWDPAKVIDTISTEAVSPSREVFVATHAPLRIRRRATVTVLRDTGGAPEDMGERVDETVILKDFLTRPPANGVLLMPVIGDSGTGKSHLVRWIKEHTPSSATRRVIYLPKTRTSLAAVVGELLAGVEGDHFAQLRRDVRRLDQEVDQAGLEQRLLNHLAEALARTQLTSELADARPLIGPRGLTVLLYDPHVREYLLQPGSLIPRLAANLLADRRQDEGERPVVFTVEDLPLDIADLTKASNVAQTLLRLVMNRPSLQHWAVELLNQNLDVAVMTASNLGVGRLQRAMLDLREEFARRGQELVLLIEDFALIQGVQRDLLDAIIEVAVREGRQVLAPIRTLLAVTSGYFQRLADTVTTRAAASTPYVYDLDVQFGNDVSTTDLTSFTGRYLNAARLGRAALERSAIRSADEVTNVCDECPVREDCHPSFGTSAEGYGLYPFNASALLRAVHSRTPRDRPTAFNPRTVLGQVLRNVLIEHVEALREGTFPGERFRQDYPTAPTDTALSIGVSAALEDLDSLDARRRALLLEFWGDAPQTLINLHPQVHTAFDIPMLVIEQSYQPTPLSLPSDEPIVEAPPIPRALQVKLQAVEDWAGRGQVLKQDTASELRGIIRNAVVRRCQWTDPLVPEPRQDILRQAWPPNATVVSIEDAGGEGIGQGEGAPIRFTRSPANAAFFLGILNSKAGQQQDTGAHVRRLQALADRHGVTLQRAVQRVQSLEEENLMLGVRVSLLGAALAGRVHPRADDPALFAAIFDEGRTWQRADEALRTPTWLSLWQRHREGRRELVDSLRAGFGISQGLGRVRMLDGSRTLPVLREATSAWTWTTPPRGLPTWIAKAVAGFAEWDAVMTAQVQHLTDWLSRTRAHLPRGTTYSDTVEAVAKALEGALDAGIGIPIDVLELRRQLAAARDWDASGLDALQRDLERLPAIDGQPNRHKELVTVASIDRGATLSLVADFLAVSDTWLTAGLREASLRTNLSGDNAVAGLDALLRRWRGLQPQEDA